MTLKIMAEIMPQINQGGLSRVKDSLRTGVADGGGGQGRNRQTSLLSNIAGSIGGSLKFLGIIAGVLTALNEVARPVFAILKLILRPMALAIMALTRFMVEKGGFREAIGESRKELRENPLAFFTKTLLGGAIGSLIGGTTGGLIGASIGPIFGDVANSIAQSLGGAFRTIADSIEGGGIGGKALKGVILGAAILIEGLGKTAKIVDEGITNASKSVQDSLSNSDSSLKKEADAASLKLNTLALATGSATTGFAAFTAAMTNATNRLENRITQARKAEDILREITGGRTSTVDDIAEGARRGSDEAEQLFRSSTIR